MEKWCGKVAIVTGASSGIGAATARALTSHGMTVLALARRQDRLQELADELAKEGVAGKLYPFKTDLRKEEGIQAAFDWVDKELGGADVLVNNAGILSINRLSEGNMEEWRELLDVNVLAVSFCTKLFLNSIERRNNQNGHIFFINSLSGHLAEFASLPMYCASKHAVKAISMCLRHDLAEKNSTIKVTSISPGPVKTEILMNNLPGSQEFSEKVAWMEGSDVASAVVNALSASSVTEMCEIVMNSKPSKIVIY